MLSEKAINKAIAERIRAAREQAGISITTLAELAGMSRVGLSYIGNGNRRVSAAKLIHIAETLEKPLSFFLTDLDKPTAPARRIVSPPLRKIKPLGFSPFLQ